MDLKYYGRNEFERILTDEFGLTKTDERTKTWRFWRTRGGKLLMVPEAPENDRYGDYVLDEIIRRLRAIGEYPVATQTKTAPATKPAAVTTKPAK